MSDRCVLGNMRKQNCHSGTSDETQTTQNEPGRDDRCAEPPKHHVRIGCAQLLEPGGGSGGGRILDRLISSSRSASTAACRLSCEAALSISAPSSTAVDKPAAASA